MKDSFNKGKRIGYQLANENPDVLEELLDTLRNTSKLKQGLIDGFKDYSVHEKEKKEKKIDYICKCGNCTEMDGFRACDKYCDLEENENFLDYFYCVRCGEYNHINALEKGKHPDAPNKPIEKNEYEKIKKRRSILKAIQSQEQDREEEHER